MPALPCCGQQAAEASSVTAIKQLGEASREDPGTARALGVVPTAGRTYAAVVFHLAMPMLLAAIRLVIARLLVDVLAQDLRFSVRLMLRDRWFSAATVVTLALGIGAVMSVFTILNGMNLRALPVEEPDRIMHVQAEDRRAGRQSGVSYADFLDWQRGTRTFMGLAAYTGATMNVGDEDRPAQRLSGTYISANGFSVLGERPVLGRDFHADDDRPGATPVVILAHAVWADRYGRDAALIGRTIRVNGVPTTVVGVMPEGFRFPVLSDLWQPLALLPGLSRDARNTRSLAVFGRLADGETMTEAGAELRTMAAALAARHPETNEHLTASVIPFTVQYAGRLSDPPPMLMMGAVAFVLLIACANAANLLLSRSVHRAREISLRAAVGASRGRLIGQLLVESIVLAGVASLLGLLLSLAGVRLFTAETADFNLPYWMDFSIDAPVFAFLTIVCLFTALLFGLAPAWHLARTAAHDVLKEGGRGVVGSMRTRRWTGALLIGELALTLTLLAGAGLLIRSAAVLYQADSVIDSPNLLAARLSLPPAAYPTPGDRWRFIERLQQRLDVVGPVVSATIASTTPFAGASMRQLVLDREPAAARLPNVQSVAVGARYFETLGITSTRGRLFVEDDARPGQLAAVVNERFAARYFPAAEPIGIRLRLVEPGADPAAAPWLTIVGITPSIRQTVAGDVGPVVYVPLQIQPPPNLALIARGRLTNAALAAALRQEVHAIDRDVALYNIGLLERVSQQSRWIPRAMSTALTIVAILALILAALGLFAAASYSVAQRTAEIGIRMALGAARLHVIWLFSRRALVQSGVGLTIGLGGAFGTGQLLQGFLARTNPIDGVTLVGVMIVLAGVAVVATLVPAARAARVDPVVALRHE